MLPIHIILHPTDFTEHSKHARELRSKARRNRM